MYRFVSNGNTSYLTIRTLLRDRETGVDAELEPWNVSLMINVGLRAATVTPCHPRSRSQGASPRRGFSIRNPVFLFGILSCTNRFFRILLLNLDDPSCNHPFSCNFRNITDHHSYSLNLHNHETIESSVAQ